MGKHDKNHETEFNDELANAEKKVREIRRKVISKCNHLKKNGNKLNVAFLDGNRVRCKRCQTEFNISPIKRETVNSALSVIHDMINQTRCMSTPEKPRDIEISEDLGVLNFDVREAAELYERVIRNKGDKNKNRDRDRDDHGGRGGFGPLSLGGRGGKEKDKGKNRNNWL